MKSFGTRYVARNTRTVALPSDFRHLTIIIRKILIWAALLGIFAVSVNMLVKTVVSKAATMKFDIKLAGIKLPEMSFFSGDKYLIEDDGRDYVVGSGGKTRPAGPDAGGKYLVRLIGISVNEKREEYLKLYKQALAIDRKYLAEASDINLKNPKNIIMITADGGTVYFGDSITRDKLENFSAALDKMKETGRRFKTMNLLYKDMVIIK
jgi:hypothetical protein